MPLKSILGLVGGIGNAYLTDQFNQKNAIKNQKYWEEQLGLTYKTNEKAADNAMKRSIDMYNLMQSPSAMVKQLKAAGLNPALMYSNSGMGGHTTQGAQGGVSGASGAPNPLGLQNFIDPMAMAQIANLDADTKKKKKETEKTEYEIDTEKWNAEVAKWNAKTLEQGFEFNEATWAANYEKAYAEAKRLNGLAQQELTKGAIEQQQFETEVARRIQEVANMKLTGELLKSNKKLTDEQIKEVIKHVEQMDSVIEVNGSVVRLNNTKTDDLLKRFNAEYGWNFTKQDLFNSLELGIDAINTLIKALEAFLPQKQIVQILETIVGNKKETITTTTTKKG